MSTYGAVGPFSLLWERPDCPVCEGPCREPFHRGSYRIGDRMPPHPTAVRTNRDLVEADGFVRYQAGQKVPYSEAVRLGLVIEPEEPKPRRGKRKGPAEHRAHLGPEEDR